MKRCATTHVNREFRINTMRYTIHLSEWPRSRTLSTRQMLVRLWNDRNSHSLLVGMEKSVQPLQKTVWQFLTKINMFLPHNSAITFLDIFSDELKTYVHVKTCTWIFIATFFIVAKTWKQPRCPSIGQWMNKLWYIYTIKHFSVIKN